MLCLVSRFTSSEWFLIACTPSQAAAAIAEVAETTTTTATKLSRYLSGPPPNFPPGPTGDQSVAMLADPLSFIQFQQQQYGNTVGMLLGGEWVVLVSSPEAAQQVLIDQPDVFVKEGTAFFPGSSLTGNGLLVSDGEVWKRQRRLSNPAFRKAAVDAYAEQMVLCTQQLLNGSFATAAAGAGGGGGGGGVGAGAKMQGSQAGGVRDVYVDYNELTLNITLAALFGISTAGQGDESAASMATAGATSSSSRKLKAAGMRGTNAANDAGMIVESVEKAFTYFTNRGAAALALPEWVPLPDNVEFTAAVKQLDAVVYDIIATRRAELLLDQTVANVTSSSSSSAGATRSNGSHLKRSDLGDEGSTSNSSSETSSSSSSSYQRETDASSSARGGINRNSSGSGSGNSSVGGSGSRKDLLQALLDSKDDSGQGMSDVALRDELMTLLVAGQETSAILLGWATALLAYHPEVQQAAAEEVQEVRFWGLF